jgi:hypothetical protein
VLQMLDEDVLREVTKLISNLHETWQRQKDFTEVIIKGKAVPLQAWSDPEGSR